MLGSQITDSVSEALMAALPQGFPLHALVLEQSPPGAESSDRVQPPTQPRHWQQSTSELPRSNEGGGRYRASWLSFSEATYMM